MVVNLVRIIHIIIMGIYTEITYIVVGAELVLMPKVQSISCSWGLKRLCVVVVLASDSSVYEVLLLILTLPHFALHPIPWPMAVSPRRQQLTVRCVWVEKQALDTWQAQS